MNCAHGAVKEGQLFSRGQSHFLHLSWDMALSKASSAVSKQMFSRLHPVPGNLYFVLTAASAITSAARLRRQLKRGEQDGSHNSWPGYLIVT